MPKETPEIETAEAKRAFDARVKRVEDAIALRKPDRVPIYLTWRFWPARKAGMTCEQAMYDMTGLSAATRTALLEYQPDCFQLPHGNIGMGASLEAMDFKALVWPGHGVDPDVSYQYIDAEYMTADEYDQYLFDPTGFMLRTYIPRVAGAAKGFEKLPKFPAFPQSRIGAAFRVFSNPEVAAALEALIEAGRAAEAVAVEAASFLDDAAELGFPALSVANAQAPFDQITDFLRGSKGALLDMYRRPDKLLEIMDKIRIFITDNAIATAQGKRGNHVFIPLHWGLDGFMSLEQFKTFYWPQLRQVCLDLIDAGLVPYVFWEGDVGSRLEHIGDIPAGKAIYKFERTDLFRAKEILGDVVCLQGNVPASMLNTGTPDEVDEYCRKLIETVGKGGGFILDGAAGVPDEARAENVAAMVASVHKYEPAG